MKQYLFERRFMKKVIGLIPLFDEKKDSYWMLPGYMGALEQCGICCNKRDEMESYLFLKALEQDKWFMVGVQWHPEFAYQKDEESRKLVQAFIDACI
jgi:CTP synthase (UTP-ammonia lyase)